MDKDKKKLYVEVKLKVNDSAVGQLIRYDGLANNPDARFMLVGLTFMPGIMEGLAKHGYEYKEINLDDARNNQESITLYKKRIPRNKSKFETVEQLIQSFNANEQRIARAIFDYAYGLEGVYYYLSDGIMFRRATRSYKFLSITTKGNRVLFHVPVKMRNHVFERFRDKVKISIPVNPRDKNQICVELNSIDSFERIKELINLAYEKRE